MPFQNTRKYDIDSLNVIIIPKDTEISNIHIGDYEENYNNIVSITKSTSSGFTSYEMTPENCKNYSEKYDNLVYISESLSVDRSVKKAISEHIVDLDLESTTTTRAETDIDTDTDTEAMENLENSGRSNGIEELRKKNQNNDRYFSDLKILTFILFIVGLSATSLSVLGRYSQFAILQYPMRIDEAYMPVSNIGLFEVKACSSTRRTENIMHSNFNPVVDKKSGYLFESILSSYNNKTTVLKDDGCSNIQIYIGSSHDLMWNLSRFFNSLSIYFNLVTTLLFATWFFDRSRVATLKSISICQLFTYFISSLTFLFFESEVCREYGCLLSIGSIYLMCSCFLWFVTGICVFNISEQIK